jgi:hypothetical protein
MRRNRFFLGCFGAISLSVAGLALGVVGPASAKVSSQRAAKVTIVNVTIGKPTELAFTLSKFSALPVGSFTFDVKNLGLGAHNFEVCTSPTTGALPNSCVGKATAFLRHGQTAVLTMVITKTGKYEYLCTVTGHAAAGMKGLFGVGVKVTAAAATSTAATTKAGGATTTTTTTASTTSGGGSTTSGGGTTAGGGGGGGGAAAECPAGETIQQGAAQNGDHDDDDEGGPTDGDGCF